MAKIAVVLLSGFVESETMMIVDILRRAQVQCDTFYCDEPFVQGNFGICIKGDKKFDEAIKEYDMLVVSGNLTSEVKEMITYFDSCHKIVGYCSNTEVLEHDGKILVNEASGTTFSFAYGIAELFNHDVSVLKEKMLYTKYSK